MVDAERQLVTRGLVLTDELSFRDDFIGDSLGTVISGLVTFTAGTAAVTGDEDTRFTEEVKVGDYIMKSSDVAGQVNVGRVWEIHSDSELWLMAEYTGTTAAGVAATFQRWVWHTNGGGSVAVEHSYAKLSVGTASGDHATIYRFGDYLPYTLKVRVRTSQRILNQTIRIGFVDDEHTPIIGAYADIVGGTDTSIRFVTRAGPDDTYDVESTEIPLLGGASLLSDGLLQIDLLSSQAVLSINGVPVATHQKHIPGPYDSLCLFGKISNSGITASGTTLFIDLVHFQNFDMLEIGKTPQSDPLKVVVVSSAAGIPGYVFANCSSSGTGAQQIMETTYTEPTSGSAAKEILSSSAADASAGTGARTVRITYYDNSMMGPYLLDITLNGTTPVSVTPTNVRYIERIEVTTIGSGGSNAGTITLRHVAGSAVIGTIAIGRNRTNWALHYVPLGFTCSITSMMYGCKGSAGGLGYLTAKSYAVETAPNRQITEYIRAAQDASRQRVFSTPLRVAGPARILGWCIPDTNNMTQSMSMDYFEQV